MYDLSRTGGVITIQQAGTTNPPCASFPISEWQEIGDLAIRYGVIAAQFDTKIESNDWFFHMIEGNRIVFYKNTLFNKVEVFPYSFSEENIHIAQKISDALARAVKAAVIANITATVAA